MPGLADNVVTISGGFATSTIARVIWMSARDGVGRLDPYPECLSVIKRLFGEYLMSRLTKTQNRKLSFRCIIYNMHRLTNLIVLMMFST